MQIKQLCGKNVSPVGLGCMGMSEFYGESDDDASVSLLSTAYDLGYRHFDTADMYGRGHNELLLAQFLKGLTQVQKEEIIVASKVGIVRDPLEKYAVTISNDRDYIKKSCEDSLQRLGIECIDLYYLHRLKPGQDIEEVLATFEELIREGKIKNIGLCEVDAETLEKATSIHKVSALQCEYSLWSRDIEGSVLPICEKHNIPLVAFSPLGRGFLTGAVTKETMSTAKKEEDLRTRLPRFNGDNFDNNMVLIDQFDSVASRAGLEKSQMALAWLLAQSQMIHLIPGTRRSKYLKDNFDAQELELSFDIVNELSGIFEPDDVHGARYPAAIDPKR